MTNYIATTESGATYKIKGGFWEYNGSHGHSFERIWSMKAIDRAEFLAQGTNDAMWDYLNEAPDTLVPEVGKLLYVASRDHWRISTEVVSVDEID